MGVVLRRVLIRYAWSISLAICMLLWGVFGAAVSSVWA